MKPSFASMMLISLKCRNFQCSLCLKGDAFFPAFRRSLFLLLPYAWCFLVCCIGLHIGSVSVNAESLDAHSARTATLYFENDLFGGTDQFYTNAVQLSLVSQDLHEWAESREIPDELDSLLASLPFAGEPDALYNVSLTLGQHIYTPSDTQVRSLRENDRPYAGWLYSGLGLHAKKGDTLDTIQLALGVVGPMAQGETAQNEVHSLRNIKTAKGWDNQLHNELGMTLTWERAWRLTNTLAENTGWAWGIIPHIGMTVGNVLTQANAGGELRFGMHLPADFGTSGIRPGAGVSAPTENGDPRLHKGVGAYLFLGTDVRAVARNIFLDGNTFTDSPHIAKKSIVADISGGVAFLLHNWRLSYTHIYRTEEFHEQDRAQHFGSVQVAWTF